MKALFILVVAVAVTGCISIPGADSGTGSTRYQIKITQKTSGAGGFLGVTRLLDPRKKDRPIIEGAGGVVINIGQYERDKVNESRDDRSAAKGATSETSPTVDVTP